MLVGFVWGRLSGFSVRRLRSSPLWKGRSAKCPPPNLHGAGQPNSILGRGHRTSNTAKSRKLPRIPANSQVLEGRVAARLGQVSEFWSGQNILCQNASAGTFLHCNLPTHPTWTHYLWLARNMKKSARFVKKNFATDPRVEFSLGVVHILHNHFLGSRETHPM